MSHLTTPQPHTRIRPASGWFTLDLRELWAYRDLLAILMARDIKIRYKQTLLGVIWVILQPLVAALLFAVIFGKFANLPSGGVPYGLYVFAALLPWNLFSGALQRAGTSLISDSRLIAKVYFPRIVIPVASTGAVLVDFIVAWAVGIVLMLVYGLHPTWRMLLVPGFLVITLMLTVGVSLFVSALNVYYRDFMYALPFVIQVWMYASPVAYSVDIVPENVAHVYAINPLAGIIDGFRWALLDTAAFPWASVIVSLGISTLILAGGVVVFQRIEAHFADVI